MLIDLKIEIIPAIFSDPNRIELKMSNGKTYESFQILGKNRLQSTPWVSEKITREIGNI